jgi:hypothetical protein
MHFCKAKIAIGGDIRNVMARSEYNPVSWPEVAVLRMVHGDGSIDEIEPFVSVPQKPRDERQRLAMIYGEDPLKEIWGGRSAPDEMEAPGARLRENMTWFNTLTDQIEITGPDGRGSQSLPPEASPSASQFEARPAVEIVGQPMARPPVSDNDPYSEYAQAEEDPIGVETPKPRKK